VMHSFRPALTRPASALTRRAATQAICATEQTRCEPTMRQDVQSVEAQSAQQFQRCFVAWVAPLTRVPVGVVAIDGKTVPRSGGKAGKAPSI
jgi:hypothetical protein